MPMGIFYLRYDWIGMVAFPLHLYIKLDVSDPWMYRFACSVIETFYLQTFDIYWLFFLIFSAIVWPLQHEKWNDVDNTKISRTSLIGCCVAICRDSGSMDYDRRISIGRSEPYHQLPSRNVRGDY